MCLKFIMCFHFFHNVYFPMLVYIGEKRMYFKDFSLSSIEAINTHTGENPSYFFNNTLLMEHLLYIQENLSLTSLFLEKCLYTKGFFWNTSQPILFLMYVYDKNDKIGKYCKQYLLLKYRYYKHNVVYIIIRIILDHLLT